MRARAPAVAGAIAGALAALPPLLGQPFLAMDLARVDLGLLCALKERLASSDGSLLLSPLLGNGGLLLARPDAQLFYPLRWLSLLLPPDAGVALEVVLHLAIAAAATAWLLRTFGARPFTAAAMGVAFAASGTVLDLLRHAHYLVAAAWLPLVWAGARAALRRRGGRPALLAVFAGLAGCLLGAEPQSFAVGAGLIAVEVGLHAARRRKLPAGAAHLAAIVAAALLVGLVQWAPTLGELKLSPRTGNLPEKEALVWSMGGAEFLGTVLPGMPSRYVQGVASLKVALANDVRVPPAWNKTPYVGLLAICAALFALRARRLRSAAVVAIGGAIFSAGDTLPVLPLLMKALPFLARFRYPAKYWLVTSLAIFVLAALALDAVARSPRLRRRFLAFGAAGLGLCVIALAAVGLSSSAIDARAASVGVAMGQAALPTLSAALLEALAHAAVAVGLALAVSWQPRLKAYAAGLIAIDLLAAVPFAAVPGPPLAPIAAVVPPTLAPPAVLCVHPALAGRLLPFTDGALDRATLLSLRAHLLPELHACSGVRAALGYSPMESSASAALALGVSAHAAPAIRALGCTHFLAPAPFRPDVPEAEERYAVDVVEAAARTDVGLYRLPDPLPEAFVSKSPALAATEAEAVARVARARSAESAAQVVDAPLASAGALPAGDAVASIAVTAPSPARATLTISGSGGAVVGLRRPFLAGWSAAQNGHALPTVRIAAHQLGVVVADVAAGPIELTYAPPNRSLGWAAFAGGLGLLATAVAAQRRRRAAQ